MNLLSNFNLFVKKKNIEFPDEGVMQNIKINKIGLYITGFLINSKRSLKLNSLLLLLLLFNKLSFSLSSFKITWLIFFSFKNNETPKRIKGKIEQIKKTIVILFFFYYFF